jgi:hypothetical protein
MGRWILLLPLCLFIRGQSPAPEASAYALSEDLHVTEFKDSGAKQRLRQATAIAMVAAWSEDPFARLAPALDAVNIPPATMFATLAALGESPLLPATLAPAFEDQINDFYENKRRKAPLAFLEEALERGEREVLGYSAHLRKIEKVGGYVVEELEVSFRQKPFSVYMNWLQGARALGATRVIYVEGENKNKLLAKPKLSFMGIQERAVDAPDAKAGSRYTIDHFGMHKGTERTLASMNKARDRGQLHLRYVGEGTDTRLGGVPCYIFVRKPYEPLEEEGLNELILFVDKANWLQVGSILKDAKGDVIAEYFFKDVRVNPVFPEWQFTRKALEMK